MNFTDEQIINMEDEIQGIRRASVSLRLDLQNLGEQLRTPRAKVFLYEGVMRRLGLIEHSLERIFQIYRPNRQELLAKDEQNDIVINVHAFVINVYGVLDNVAWVVALENHFPDPDTNKMKIGLFSKGLRPFLPPGLGQYLDGIEMVSWFNNYAKVYRDATAHRIAPYLPPKTLTKMEAEKFQQLDASAFDALMRRDYVMMDRHREERNLLGRPVALIALSVSGEEPDNRPFLLHPQILCDTLTVHEVLQHFGRTTREQHGFADEPLQNFSNRANLRQMA